MKRRHEISDEQLAAYMENLFGSDRQEPRNLDVDSIEVLGVSRKALEMFRLPDWRMEDEEFRADDLRRYAMTGFLGDEDDEDPGDGGDGDGDGGGFGDEDGFGTTHNK